MIQTKAGNSILLLSGSDTTLVAVQVGHFLELDKPYGFRVVCVTAWVSAKRLRWSVKDLLWGEPTWAATPFEGSSQLLLC